MRFYPRSYPRGYLVFCISCSMEDIARERVCAAALGRIFGFEPLYVSGLISKLGSAAAVFGLSPKEADAVLGPFSKYRGRICAAELDAAAKELEDLDSRGFRYIACTEEVFPALLRDCPDCPAGLYYSSSSEPRDIFSGRPAVAVVGTRDVSPYGREWTRKMVDACAQAPSRPCVVSGLAFGVDIAAHLAALDNGLPTIAVLPCGIDTVYPAAHRKAAERIAAAPASAVITDYPRGTPPVAFTFIRRNRIIAGLAACTVLVESKAKGGGLITCKLADSYGREVFALPGRVDDLRSAGCNALIRSGSAQAITGVEGLGEQLGLGRYELRRKAGFAESVAAFYGRRADTLELNSITRMASLIAENRGIELEEICYRSGEPYNEVARIAMMLETDGFICIDLMQRCTINARK